MAVRIEDPGRLKSFIDADQLRNAIIAQRVFLPRDKSFFLANDEKDIEALAVVENTTDPEETRSLAMQGSVSEAAKDVVRALPVGKYWLHLANEDLLAVFASRMRLGWHARAWLLSLAPGDLRASRTHETRSIDARWAHKIAAVWSTDWNADEYVKSRIENGPSSGIFVDNELVAWGLTHFETENVSMLGFLNVLPEYRGRGLAESITADVAAQVIASGRIPACHVYEHNFSSLGLLQRSGFKRVCRQVWGDAVTRA